MRDHWYAALFHRAWVLIARPDDAQAHDDMRAAHERWLTLHAADLQARQAKPTSGDLYLLAAPIRQALKLPKGNGAPLRPKPEPEQPGA